MESSYFCICCHGGLNGLNIFKVKGQGHREIDISFLIISHPTCETDRNVPSSIFMFGFKVNGQGHGEIDLRYLDQWER
jgi:hypothetical protein